MTAVLGIDPGKTGAVAYLAGDFGTFAIDMPIIGKEVDVRALAEQIRGWDVDLAIIEYQQAMPQQGVSSTFTTGEGYGMLKGMLYGLGLRVEIVRAAAWKKGMGIPAGSDKDVSRELAARLFPSVQLTRKKDHGRAEALLIAEWGRRCLATRNAPDEAEGVR